MLKVMHHYFGRVIFDSMIVIGTERASKSTLDAFSEKDITDNQKVFKRAFQLALAAPDQDPDEVQDIPQPPIIYLSLEESSSDVLKRLQQTKVTRMDGLQLQLQENTCAKCSLKFGVHMTATGSLPVVSIRENDGVRSAYHQSHCHPLILFLKRSLKPLLSFFCLWLARNPAGLGFSRSVQNATILLDPPAVLGSVSNGGKRSKSITRVNWMKYMYKNSSFAYHFA